jgi:hypothetical protein
VPPLSFAFALARVVRTVHLYETCATLPLYPTAFLELHVYM